LGDGEAAVEAIQVREILQRHLRRSYADDRLPKTVLQEARLQAAQARYDAALERYVWFYRHALEYNEGLAGVRLSFVLGEWVELGQKYPPARDALLSVRDEATTAFENGKASFKLFMDVAAINRYLQDDARTVELFKLLRQRDPELAGQCYPLAERALVDSGEYAICISYLGDLGQRLEAIRQSYLTTREIPEGNIVLNFREAGLKAYADLKLAEQTSRLIAILDGAGRLLDADRVRDFVRAQGKR
jgi:hypothetical protein